MVIAYLSGILGDQSGIWVVLGIEILTLGVVFAFLKGYRRKSDVTASNIITKKSTPSSTEKVSKTSPLFIASYLSVMLWGVVSTVVLGLFPSYIEILSDQGLPFVTEDFGNLLLIWNLARTVAFIATARLSGEHMRQVIVFGAILSAVSGLVMFLFVDIWVFAIAMVLAGVAVGFNYLGALYLVVSATDIEKGAHAGLVESMGGVGLFLGPIVGGWIMEMMPSGPYLMYSVLSVVVLFLIIALLRRDRSKG
jgi:MFS family permease